MHDSSTAPAKKTRLHRKTPDEEVLEKESPPEAIAEGEERAAEKAGISAERLDLELARILGIGRHFLLRIADELFPLQRHGRTDLSHDSLDWHSEVHLDKLAVRVREGVTAGGMVGMRFNTIGVSDGISMGHEGMRASLVSREVIADSVETVMHA